MNEIERKRELIYASPEDPEKRQKMDQEAKDALQRARTQLAYSTPFFSHLTTYMKEEVLWPEEWWNPSLVPTAATDGKTLYYNPGFILYLIHYELCFLLCHEVMHAALQHPKRLAGRDPYFWNVACDYAVNATIIKYIRNSSGEASRWLMPKGGLYNVEWEGKSADEIYPLITPPEEDKKIKGKADCQNNKDKEDDKKGDSKASTNKEKDTEAEKKEYEKSKGQQDGQPKEKWSAAELEKAFDEGACTQMREPSKDDKQVESQPEEWARRLTRACKVEGWGSLPSELEQHVDGLLNPVLDWRILLERFVSRAIKADYTWKIPNRRFVFRRVYLPSCRSESLGEVILVLDDSGSCYKFVAQFLGEAAAIFAEFPGTVVHVIACDVHAEHIIDWEPGVNDPDHVLKGSGVTIRGGGGTSFVAPFELVRERNDWNPSCMIYLTDLWGKLPGPELDPGCPVLWVCANDKHTATELPFGELCSCPELAEEVKKRKTPARPRPNRRTIRKK